MSSLVEEHTCPDYATACEDCLKRFRAWVTEQEQLTRLCTKCQGPLHTEVWVFNMNGHDNQFCSRDHMIAWCRRKGVDRETIRTLEGK